MVSLLPGGNAVRFNHFKSCMTTEGEERKKKSVCFNTDENGFTLICCGGLVRHEILELVIIRIVNIQLPL